jgi:uncharacterized protein (TIGR02453 family)
MAVGHSVFEGIPEAATGFFAELEHDNTAAWWAANNTTYETTVRAPFVALLDSLDYCYLPWRVYRPRRDIRFSVDKTPYKTFIGAVSQEDSGNGHFIRLDRRGLLVGSGYPMLARDQLIRFREAIDAEGSGNAFISAVAAAKIGGVDVTAGRYDRLTGAPRGFRRDHPRIDWLRAKGVELPTRVGTPSWLCTSAASTHVSGLLKNGPEVIAWLNTHVGPSELTPEEIWSR